MQLEQMDDSIRTVLTRELYLSEKECAETRLGVKVRKKWRLKHRSGMLVLKKYDPTFTEDRGNYEYVFPTHEALRKLSLGLTEKEGVDFENRLAVIALENEFSDVTYLPFEFFIQRKRIKRAFDMLENIRSVFFKEGCLESLCETMTFEPRKFSMGELRDIEKRVRKVRDWSLNGTNIRLRSCENILRMTNEIKFESLLKELQEAHEKEMGEEYEKLETKLTQSEIDEKYTLRDFMKKAQHI